MPTLLSAGVTVTESDLISYVSPVSSSIGAFVGHFNWGPADELVNVNSEKALATIFGAPKINAGSESTFITSYLTAASFFQYGNSMRVMRAVSGSAKNAVGHMESYGDTSPSPVLIKNKEIFDITNYSSKSQDLLFARYPGKLGNSLEVQFYHAGNTSPLGAHYNSTLAADCKRIFGKLPGTTYWSTYMQSPELVNDEVYVAVFDMTGYISGTVGAILEVYQGVSLQSGAKTTTGANNYYVDVINLGSSYIYINEAAKRELATLTHDLFSLTYSTSNFIFSGGQNGLNSSDAYSITHVTDSLGLNLLLDTENTNIDLLFAETFTGDTANAIAGALYDIVEIRKDLMAFVSAPLELYTYTSNADKLTNALKVTSGVGSSSFLFYDNTPVYVYNKYTDKYYWTPACGHMAGLCAYTDAIADPWFSPAGLNRGQLRGVTKLAYNAPQQDRDDLYNANINSIISLPGAGIVLYGDKTGLTHPSSFDRINVRRLFIAVEKACRKASSYQLFQLNDAFTQRAFRNTIDPYLRDIRSRRGIIDYAIVCDDTNNTPAVVNANRFVADIYIKPAHSINFIQLNFIATRDTVTLSEISG